MRFVKKIPYRNQIYYLIWIHFTQICKQNRFNGNPNEILQVGCGLWKDSLKGHRLKVSKLFH